MARKSQKFRVWYRADKSKPFQTLEEAKAYAQVIFTRKGSIVAITFE